MRNYLLVLCAVFFSLSATHVRADDEDRTDPDHPDRYWAFRVGGDLGYATIEHESYIAANLVGMLRVGPVRADVWGPLLFRTDGFEFRKEDWDDARDFNRIVRCARLDIGDYTTPSDTPATSSGCDVWGWNGHGIHDRFYLNLRLSPLESVSLGDSTLVSSFRNSEDLNRPELGLQSDMQVSDYTYYQAFLDNISDPHVIGGRLAVRPLQVFLGENWDETPDDMEAGVTFASDLHAPLHLQTAFGRPLIDGNGDLRFDRQTLSAIGADFHYLYFWNLEGASDGEPRHGLYMFANYNRFLEVSSADGLHAGLRYVYTYEALGWDVRLGAEYQYIGRRYTPSYFDDAYVARSQRFGLTDEALALPGVTPQTTLLEYIKSQPGGHTHGFEAYFKVTFPIPTSATSFTPLPLLAYIEGADAEASWTESLVLGPFVMDQLIVAAQYLRRNFDGLKSFFKVDGSLIRIMGRFYFGDPSREDASFVDSLHIDAEFNRRYFQSQQGAIVATNDFITTLGFSTGN